MRSGLEGLKFDETSPSSRAPRPQVRRFDIHKSKDSVHEVR